jgi:hypothetical protein
LSIAVEVQWTVGASLSGGVAEQRCGFGNDPSAFGADQTHQADLHPFRTLRLIARHQGRHAQTGGFLLNASRVSHDQIRATHRRYELTVVQWFNTLDLFDASEVFAGGFPNGRVWMNREKNANILERHDEIAKGQKDVSEWGSERLAPMGSDQDEAVTGVEDTAGGSG